MKRAIAIIALSVALAAAVPAALADSFNMTNSLANGVAFSGPPTNSVGTNGICLSVGGAVNVANVENAAFTFYGQGSAAGSGNVTFTLVRARTASPPATTDWETSGAITLSAPMNGTAAVVWCTNLPSTYMGGFSWVGIGSITNNNTGTVTNSAAYVDKRIHAIRWP